MIWFLKIGLCLILSGLVLEVLYCFERPLNMDEKACKIENIWNNIFGTLLSGGIISCLIYFCGLIITTEI